MTASTRFAFAAFLVVTMLAMLGSNCPSIPSIEERVVELAVGGSTTLRFEARGSVNSWSDRDTVDLAADIDLGQILEDVDFDSVKAISLAGVSYRVVLPDPDPTKAITGAHVTIQRGAGPVTPLVTAFSEDPVNAVTSFKTAPLDPAGVAVINAILTELLDAVQEGRDPVNVTVIGEGSGSASDGDTHFDWELKLDINVVGVIKLDVLS